MEIETYCYLRMHDCLVWREWGERERKKEGRKEKGFGLLHAYPREDDASGYEHLSQGCDLSVLPSLVAEAETDAGVTMVLHTLSHRDDTIPGPLNGAARDT